MRTIIFKIGIKVGDSSSGTAVSTSHSVNPKITQVKPGIETFLVKILNTLNTMDKPMITLTYYPDSRLYP